MDDNLTIDYSQPAYIIKHKLEQLVWISEKEKVNIIIKLINDIFKKEFTSLSKNKLFVSDFDKLKEKHVLNTLSKHKAQVKTKFNYKFSKYETEDSENNISKSLVTGAPRLLIPVIASNPS